MRHLKMKAADDRQLSHGQLFCRLPVYATLRAFDLGKAAEVFGAGEPAQAISQRGRL